MRIGRTLAPAASPIMWREFISGLRGWQKGQGEADRFAEEIKDYYGVDSCFLVSSGKAALTITLQALKALYPDRNEVLIPAFACYSVPSAIMRAGLKVKLCDIHPDTLDFNFDQIEQAIDSSHLLCIIPIHLFGSPADLDRLRSMVTDPQVTILEDAAQAFGARWNGTKLGTQGDVSIFSLGRGKALSAVEGGVIITRRSDISRMVEKIYRGAAPYGFGETLGLLFYALALMVMIHPWLFWLPKAVPFNRLGETAYDPDFKIRRMSSFQAGLVRGWQQKIMALRAVRKINASGWATLLSRMTPYILRSPKGDLPDFIRFPLKLESSSIRDKLLFASELKGLGVSATYPDSVDAIPELRDVTDENSFPVAKAYARQMVTLPVHHMLTLNDRENIKHLVLELGGSRLGLGNDQ